MFDVYVMVLSFGEEQFTASLGCRPCGAVSRSGHLRNPWLAGWHGGSRCHRTVGQSLDRRNADETALAELYAFKVAGGEHGIEGRLSEAVVNQGYYKFADAGVSEVFLYVAVDRTSKLVFARIYRSGTKLAAAAFLKVPTDQALPSVEKQPAVRMVARAGRRR